MINNRQNGRRRGRGGTQVRGPGGNGQDRGNRIDNRARGNAAQLHEKYKNLARDTQLGGDRVMTEYYLQFADHYFRVLSESRARFDEQNQNQNQQRRTRYDADEFDDQGDEGEGAEDSGETDVRGQEPRRYEREPQERQDRDQRPRREAEVRRDREPRYERDGNRRDDRRELEGTPPAAEANSVRENPVREDVVQAEAMPEAEVAEAPRPRRGRRPRRVEAEAGEEAPQRIEVDRLPPALAVAETAVADGSSGHGDANGNVAEGEEAPAPRRRRTRRTSAEDSNVAA